MAICLIGLGSNQGDRAGVIRRALDLLAGHDEVRLQAVSRLYQSQPVGGPEGQAAFLNAAARLETALTAHHLLALLHEIEDQLGRVRQQRWEARTLDLDLLLYEQLVLDTPQLVVPHPRMAYRRFVLVPAVEVAADLIHPPTGWSLRRLLQHLDTGSGYLAITGLPGAGKTRLASAVCRQLGCRLIASPQRGSDATTTLPGSAGPAAELEVELLRLRARLLAAEAESTGESAFRVSDFWFDQSAVYARRRLSGPARRTFVTAWQDARRTVMRPQLLVLLDAPADQATLRGATGAGFAAEGQQRLRADLLQQASLPDQGPLLRVSAVDFEWAVAEVAAAIQAMRESVE